MQPATASGTASPAALIGPATLTDDAQHGYGISHLAYLANWTSNNLPPFAMWAAFPPSDYYGGSVAVGVAPRRSISCFLTRYCIAVQVAHSSLRPGSSPAVPPASLERPRACRPFSRWRRSSPCGGGSGWDQPGLGFTQCSVDHATRVLPGGGSTDLSAPVFTDLLWSLTAFRLSVSRLTQASCGSTASFWKGIPYQTTRRTARCHASARLPPSQR